MCFYFVSGDLNNKHKFIKKKKSNFIYYFPIQIHEIKGKDIKIVNYNKDKLLGYFPEREKFWIDVTEITQKLDPPLKRKIMSS